MKTLIFVLALLCASSFPAFASDHMNLEENLPTELEDAYPIKCRGREIQGAVRYIEEGKGASRWLYQPVFEFGILPNTQLNVAGTFYSGNADRKGSGDVTSEHSRGVDVTTKLIFSKMPYVRTTFLHRLHANLIWTHNSGRDKEEERADLFKGIFGLSMRAGKDTGFILDYVREQKREKHQDANILEAGFRRQLTPFTLVTIGAGAGIGDDSEKYRVTVGFQHSF